MDSIVIENPKGSFKSFEIEDDPLWKDYPLKGVTYPVDYGYMHGYKGEDGKDLDIFIGSGSQNGYIKVWRCDVPIETKIIKNVTEQEWNQILSVFSVVLLESGKLEGDDAFTSFLKSYLK